jgi:hypothetical protein
LTRQGSNPQSTKLEVSVLRFIPRMQLWLWCIKILPISIPSSSFIFDLALVFLVFLTLTINKSVETCLKLFFVSSARVGVIVVLCQMNSFSIISWREQFIFWWAEDDDISCFLPDFYSASSLKQQSTNRSTQTQYSDNEHDKPNSFYSYSLMLHDLQRNNKYKFYNWHSERAEFWRIFIFGQSEK